jgi:hypothetical protein
MADDEEPSLRQQLIEARAKIIAQLEELSFRTHASFARRGGGPPDYTSVIAQLEAELREIDSLLDADDGEA